MRKKSSIFKGASLVLVFVLLLTTNVLTFADDVMLNFKYDDFSDVSMLSINGNALQIVDPKDNTPSIRLTNSVTWQSGSVFYKDTINLANQRSFSTFFSFNIADKSGNYGADGIVFVLNSLSNKVGTYGGGIGYQNIKNSLGIEFDTWDNGTNNGDTGLGANHISVNLNGVLSPIASVTKANNNNYDFNDGSTYYVWVDYDGGNKTLYIRINKDSNIRPASAVITKTDLDLTTALNQSNVYAGFTSATGSVFAKHYIKSWYMNNDYNPIDVSNSQNVYTTPTPIPTPTPTPTVAPTIEPTATPIVVLAPSPTLIPTPVSDDIPSGSPVKLTFSYAYLYGYGDKVGNVGADDSIKREEANALIYRLLKQNNKLGTYVAPNSSSFSDLNESRWSFSAIEYMTYIGTYSVDSKIIKPDMPITRGEAAKIIAFSLRLRPDASKSDSVAGYSDLDVTSKDYNYIKALVDIDVLKGYSDGTIRPNGEITRAEFVAMFNRLIGRDYDTAAIKCPYPDLNNSHWAYNDLILASYGFSQDTNGKNVVDPTKKPPREQIDYK